MTRLTEGVKDSGVGKADDNLVHCDSHAQLVTFIHDRLAREDQLRLKQVTGADARRP
ncbi:unnamed protein product, partial [Protopolystoma xenopodis]